MHFVRLPLMNILILIESKTIHKTSHLYSNPPRILSPPIYTTTDSNNSENSYSTLESTNYLNKLQQNLHNNPKHNTSNNNRSLNWHLPLHKWIIH